MNEKSEFNANKSEITKKAWESPRLETCDIEQTMSAAGSNADCGSPTA